MSKKNYKPFSIKEFRGLSPKKRRRWVLSQTRKVLRRLPSLKKRLSLYDDTSTRIYNLDPETLTLWGEIIANKVSKRNITSSDISSISSYLTELHSMADELLSKLDERYTNSRIEDFLENIKKVSSNEEYEYVKELIDNLSEKQKSEFVRSKQFYTQGDLASKNYVSFVNEYGISVGTAKLETWLEDYKNTKKVNEKRYREKRRSMKLGGKKHRYKTSARNKKKG